MWDKLKHEWKTFALAIAGILLETWDQIIVTALPEVGTIIDPKYQWIVHIAIPSGFLLLRRWKDAHPDTE